MFDPDYSLSQLVVAKAWCDNDSHTDLSASICRSLNSGAMTSLMKTCDDIDPQTFLTSPNIMQACSTTLPFRACLRQHMGEAAGGGDGGGDEISPSILMAHMACGDAGLVGELLSKLEAEEQATAPTSPTSPTGPSAPENGFRAKMVEIGAWCQQFNVVEGGNPDDQDSQHARACELFLSTESESSQALMGVCETMMGMEIAPPAEISLMCGLNQAVVNYNQCLLREEETTCRAEFLVL